jgi:hypothetical protein
MPYDSRFDAFTLGSTRLGERLDAMLRYGVGPGAEGRMIITHGSLAISEALSLDLTLGRGMYEASPRRLDTALVPGTLSAWPSYYDGNRSLWSLALTASRQYEGLGLGARLGYLDARERPESYAEVFGTGVRTGGNRATSLGQAFLGVDAAYGLGRAWELRGSALYRRDRSRDDARGSGFPSAAGNLMLADRNEREWAVGVRFYGGRNLKLNLEYLNTHGRELIRNESLTFTGRIEF